jgi:hypothetical protein
LKKLNVEEISLKDVYSIGNSLKSDYVVWGSITKIGSSISVDGKLVDIKSNRSDVGFFTQSQNLDEVIPKINDFSKRIVQHILGTVPATAAAEPSAAAFAPAAGPPAATTAPAPSTGASRESQIIAGMKASKRGTLTAVINPEYINAPEPLKKRGFWMSQQFPTEFKGMDIGDVTVTEKRSRRYRRPEHLHLPEIRPGAASSY